MYRKSGARQSRASATRSRGGLSNSRGNKRRFAASSAININRFINKSQSKGIVEVFKPRHTFSDFKICNALKQAISVRGFVEPMPIQDQAIPLILEGHDFIGLANTGTGKTGAFLIPIINKILMNPQERALIVVPTRELAIQIQEEFNSLAVKLGIYSVVVVGGANIGGQIRELRLRHNVVIGTPGRLKDLISRKVLNLSGCNNIVLDEADRMLDMGFISDVKLLLSLAAKKRQTMLFSATLESEIEKLVNQFLVNPQLVSITTKETSVQIDQDIIRIKAGKDKVEVLHELLIQTQFEKVLVFMRTKHGADRLSKNLHLRGFKAESIHGDKPHNKRQKALQMFKDCSVNILVATDVAARGLDIPNVSHVINYDLPATYEDYVHRIGRTGRANQTGIALTFVE